MAEARSAVTEPRVIYASDEVQKTWTDVFVKWRRQLVKGFFKTRNRIRNGLWPTHIYNLGVGVSLFSASLIGDWQVLQPLNQRLWAIGRLLHIPKGVPYYAQVLAISTTSGVMFFVVLMYARRWLLRILLSYRGWMYENPHRQSWKTKVWGVVVWMISGYHPTTYSCQNSLPHLPIPPLSSTVDKFVSSMKPIYGENSDQFQIIRADAQEFKNGLGPKLQRFLILKSYWAPNWVTDWWEKYVYLMGRVPLPINSNYYVMDYSYFRPTTRQTSRAAVNIYNYVAFKRLIDHERLPPLVLRNIIPVCMAQYERLFSTTRVPGVEFDDLVRYDSSVSKHIAVMRRGIYYRLDVYDTRGRPLTMTSLQHQLDWIVADADKHFEGLSETSRSIAALTSLGRTDWAQARTDFFASGINRESLDVVESAMFHVVLETKSFDSWSDEGQHLIHGDGTTLWFDKSLTLVFFSNGRMGINGEHSWGDAPIVGHASEYNLTTESLEMPYDEDGYVLNTATYKQAPLTTPQRLIWDVAPKLEQTIDRAFAFCCKNNDDLDLAIVEHNAYGKGFIKTCKVSPDAYVQLALQLTYFKDSGGKLAMTYESSMTRLYLLGRTETVRSLTSEGADFVRAMVDKTKTNSERIALLRKAGDVHQGLYRDAMTGRGIDRHIFGLYVISRGLGYESKFLKDAIGVPWILSTSQQPQQQMANSPDCNDPKYENKLCPGGGFGPVSDQGYGVSYMLPGDAKLFFHISSKHSATVTDSSRFARLLFESLHDMQQLFQDKSNGSKK